MFLLSHSHQPIASDLNLSRLIDGFDYLLLHLVNWEHIMLFLVLRICPPPPSLLLMSPPQHTLKRVFVPWQHPRTICTFPDMLMGHQCTSTCIMYAQSMSDWLRCTGWVCWWEYSARKHLRERSNQSCIWDFWQWLNVVIKSPSLLVWVCFAAKFDP